MKKWISALLALALCAGLLAGCGGAADDAQPEGPVTMGKGVAEGTLDGNIYRLPGIGMELHIPEGYEIVTGKALDRQLAAKASSLYRFAARRQDRQEVLTFFVLDSEQTPGQYLEEARGKLETQREAVGEVEDMRIAGFDFKVLRNEAKDADGNALVELSLVYGQDGELFCIGELCPAEAEDDARAALEQIIRSTRTDGAEDGAAEAAFTEEEIGAAKQAVLSYAAAQGFAAENLRFDAEKDEAWTPAMMRTGNPMEGRDRANVITLTGDAVFEHTKKEDCMFTLYREGADGAWILEDGNFGY